MQPPADQRPAVEEVAGEEQWQEPRRHRIGRAGRRIPRIAGEVRVAHRPHEPGLEGGQPVGAAAAECGSHLPGEYPAPRSGPRGAATSRARRWNRRPPRLRIAPGRQVPGVMVEVRLARQELPDGLGAAGWQDSRRPCRGWLRRGFRSRWRLAGRGLARRPSSDREPDGRSGLLVPGPVTIRWSDQRVTPIAPHVPRRPARHPVRAAAAASSSAGCSGARPRARSNGGAREGGKE